MANYATLKAAIQEVIKTNGNNEITGALLQQSLLAMINIIGEGYRFKGVIGPDSTPAQPDGQVFYIAQTPGHYTNVGTFDLYLGEIAVITWGSAFTVNILNQRFADSYSRTTYNRIVTSQSNRLFQYESDYTDGSVYIIPQTVALLAFRINDYWSISQICSNIGVSPVTSPSGIAGCLKLTDGQMLVYNALENAWSLQSQFTNLHGEYLLIVGQRGGVVTELAEGLKTNLLSSIKPLRGAVLSGWMPFTSVDRFPGFVGYDNTTQKKVITQSDGIEHFKLIPRKNAKVIINNVTYTPGSTPATYLRVTCYDSEDNLTLSVFPTVDSNRQVIIDVDSLPAGTTQIYVSYSLSHITELALYYDVVGGISSLIEPLKDFTPGLSFIGNGGTSSGYGTAGAFYYPKPLNGRRYRLVKIRHTEDSSLIPPTSGWLLLAFDLYKNGVMTSRLFQYSITSTDTPSFADYYDVEIPEDADADYLVIVGRGVKGERVEYRVELAAETETGVALFNPVAEFKPKFMSLKKKARVNGVLKTEPLVFAQITDCHADAVNVRRAIDYLGKFADYIDFYVNTGDNVLDSYENGNTWYANISGAAKFLFTIGNHDTASRSGSTYDWTAHIGVDAYNTFIAPYVSRWGVVQPSGAAENGFCYYYKDFATQDIRAIFLDMMKYDSAQDTWFASTLEDARVAGKTVVVFAHFPGRAYVKIDCNYTSLTPNSSASDAPSYSAPGTVMQNATMRVHDFIQAGGAFVSWVVGHTHLDIIGKIVDYPEQLVFCCDTAKHYGVNAPNNDSDSVEDTKTQDGFCAVGIDVYSKVIKVIKIGRNRDLYERVRHAFSINYETQEIFADN